jgi:hypothetical protein
MAMSVSVRRVVSVRAVTMVVFMSMVEGVPVIEHCGGGVVRMHVKKLSPHRTWLSQSLAELSFAELPN